MHITMINVVSADGKMTRGTDPNVHEWASAEDQTHFMETINDHTLVVMGRRTYEVAESKPQAERLRIVLTDKPEQFADKAVPGQLEFTNETPAQLVARLEQAGHTRLLLLGGGFVNGTFMRAGLVNELYLTVEPKLFGQGTELLGGTPADVSLQLLDYKQLNARGTLLLHYQVQSA